MKSLPSGASLNLNHFILEYFLEEKQIVNSDGSGDKMAGDEMFLSLVHEERLFHLTSLC